MAAKFIDNQTSPPKPDGCVEELVPSETKAFQVIFDYSVRIATMTDRVAVLRFCVKWESVWLRKSVYVRGTYDWNESFKLCGEIRIIDDCPTANGDARLSSPEP